MAGDPHFFGAMHIEDMVDIVRMVAEVKFIKNDLAWIGAELMEEVGTAMVAQAKIIVAIIKTLSGTHSYLPAIVMDK